MSKLDCGWPMDCFDEVAEQERAQPGQDGADDLGAQGGGHVVVPLPEPGQAFRVVEVDGHPGPELGGVEQRRDVLQGDVGVPQQGQAGHAHDVVHPRSPGFGEDAAR